MHILFVCTGNICRSPTAERLLVARAAQLGIDDVTAASAGTRAVVGHPIHPHAASVLQQLGGDPGSFTARQLTSRIACDADLVLTMDTAHRDSVLELAPRQLHRTFTFTEVAQIAAEFEDVTLEDLAAHRCRVAGGELPDVRDPMGQTPAVFAAVGAQIADLLKPVMSLCNRSLSAR